MHLLNFRFIYPSERDRMPRWLIDELLLRAQRQAELPLPQTRVCRGRLFSAEDYRIDVQTWGFADVVGPRDRPRNRWLKARADRCAWPRSGTCIPARQCQGPLARHAGRDLRGSRHPLPVRRPHQSRHGAARPRSLAEDLRGLLDPGGRRCSAITTIDCGAPEEVERGAARRPGSNSSRRGRTWSRASASPESRGSRGGFVAAMLDAFGEPAIKAFVQEVVDEALRSSTRSRMLDTERTVVVLHYAPIAETVVGEPEAMFPFLGCSRLAETIDRFDGVARGLPRPCPSRQLRRRDPARHAVFNVAATVQKPNGKAYAVVESRTNAGARASRRTARRTVSAAARASAKAVSDSAPAAAASPATGRRPNKLARRTISSRPTAVSPAWSRVEGCCSGNQGSSHSSGRRAGMLRAEQQRDQGEPDRATRGTARVTRTRACLVPASRVPPEQLRPVRQGGQAGQRDLAGRVGEQQADTRTCPAR